MSIVVTSQLQFQKRNLKLDSKSVVMPVEYRVIYQQNMYRLLRQTAVHISFCYSVLMSKAEEML